MTFKIFIISFLLLLTHFAMCQHIEWANVLLDTKYVKQQYVNNHLNMILGPASIYPDADVEKEKYDEYADGYIMIQDENKKPYIDFGFEVPMPANHLLIGGVFNDGVIKKVSLILKDYKTKVIFNNEKTRQAIKKLNFNLAFNLETVYGVQIQFDHTKINKWNIIKGIGIYKGSNPLSLKPELYDGHGIGYHKEKLPGEINTKECHEFNPKITADGSSLYFVRECPDKKHEEIWYSELGRGETWNQAKKMDVPINNHGHNYILSTTLQSNTLYVGNSFNANGDQVGPGFSIVQRQDENTWNLPQKVELQTTVEGFDDVNYFVSLDESAIFVSMQDKKNPGNLDLYVSVYNKLKKEWEPLVNLGAEINTEFKEDFPYLSSDGNFLFFCTNGRIGYGGYDLFVSKKLDHSWVKWSKPENLGSNVNSKTNDFGITISNSGKLAYFSTLSTEDTNHHADIYKFKLPKSLQQRPLTAFKGKVTSERSGVPLVANFKYKETQKPHFESHHTFSTNSKGEFIYVLPHDKEYDILIESPKHFKITDKLSLTDTLLTSRVVKNYKMQHFLDSGQIAVIENIQFEFKSSTLLETSSPSLDKLTILLKEQKNMVVEIGGHTDNIGSDTFNLKLSGLRAKSVIDYLIKKGIRPWRLKSKGFGESSPIASNETEDGRSLNRRVEMIILNDDITKKYRKERSPKQKMDLISRRKKMVYDKNN